MTNCFWGPLSTLKCLCRNFANALKILKENFLIHKQNIETR